MIIKSQRLRAVAMTAGMLAVSMLIMLVLKLAFTYLTVETAPYAAALVILSGAVYLLYSIALAQVRYEDTLKKIARK
jgi:threonine/homoserine/homoserine lactone efflux protein